MKIKQSATGPVAMGLTSVNGTTSCPKTLTVTLAGQTSSSWATDAIVKAATAIKTDSDGYKLTIQMSSNLNTPANLKIMGGCLSGAGGLTTNPVVCFYGTGVLAKTGGTVNLSATTAYYLPAKNWVTTTAITGAVAITNAKWYTVYAGLNCTAVITLTATDVATCPTSALTLASATSLDVSWFQPKEISTKIYLTMPRFSAKESATWTGMADDSKRNAAGCAAKALTGASALVAGAAVAFGAAALAF
jgi:hypothetical protein